MNLVYGVIDSEGKIVLNSGGIHRAEHLETGKYKVTFKSGTFSGDPVVGATIYTGTNDLQGQAGTNRTISVTGYSSSEALFGIRVASQGNERDDASFSFLAMG